MSEMYRIFPEGEKTMPLGWVRISSMIVTVPVDGRNRYVAQPRTGANSLTLLPQE